MSLYCASVAILCSGHFVTLPQSPRPSFRLSSFTTAGTPVLVSAAGHVSDYSTLSVTTSCFLFLLFFLLFPVEVEGGGGVRQDTFVRWLPYRETSLAGGGCCVCGSIKEKIEPWTARVKCFLITQQKIASYFTCYYYSEKRSAPWK